MFHLLETTCSPPQELERCRSLLLERQTEADIRAAEGSDGRKVQKIKGSNQKLFYCFSLNRFDCSLQNSVLKSSAEQLLHQENLIPACRNLQDPLKVPALGPPQQDPHLPFTLEIKVPAAPKGPTESVRWTWGVCRHPRT